MRYVKLTIPVVAYHANGETAVLSVGTLVEIRRGKKNVAATGPFAGYHTFASAHCGDKPSPLEVLAIAGEGK